MYVVTRLRNKKQKRRGTKKTQRRRCEACRGERSDINHHAREQWSADNADIAEDDGHHPDLHIEGYRNVSVELWTHAIGGLSENDFILAAKIDRLPIKVKD